MKGLADRKKPATAAPNSRGLLRAAALVGFAALMVSDASAQTPPAPPPAKDMVPIIVTARGFKGTRGQAIVAVYNSEGTWLKLDKATRLIKTKIEKSELQVKIPDLPQGVYAVSVIHDENMNGKLDMHWFPIPGPDEGAGVSNDATATIGPPSYNDSRFKLLERGASINLNIRY